METKPNKIVMPAHPTNRWSRYGQKIEYIVLHYVGAVSSAKNNGEYFANTANLGASAHYFVDETTVVSSVPLQESAGHCGVDYSGARAPFWSKCCNRNSIGIEMCCKKDSRGNWYLEPETVHNALALVKTLMQRYGIDAGHVVRHYDVCWKICPEPWVRDESQWRAFKQRLEEKNTQPKWYEQSGEWAEAKKLGITDGTRPEDQATRAEVAAMVLRAKKLEARP